MLHRTDEDPCVFMFYEKWVSREDLDSHLTMSHLEPLSQRREELPAKSIDVCLLTMTCAPPG